MARKYIRLFTIIITYWLLTVLKAQGQELTFISPLVEEGVRKHLNFAEDKQISFLQLDTITTLDLSRRGITDIRDLVLMPKLRTLDLSDNQIEDLRPLTVLDSLEWLDLRYNSLKGINELYYSSAKELTINVSFNYIKDFSLFAYLSSCNFTLIGTGLQYSENPIFFEVNSFYADLNDEEQPVISYRGYTNMTAATSLKYGSSSVPAKLDGNTYQVDITEGIAETTQVTISNGEVGEETYIVPAVNFQVEPGQTIILEMGLPEDYELSYALATVGKVEIVGNVMHYTAPDKASPDVIYFCYYKNYSIKGYSRFYINGGEVTSESITISKAKQVPYYSKYNLNFTDKPELKAYVATGYDKATGTIWLTRVKQVPAETGFLLMGEPGDYDIPVVQGVSDCYYKNMFKGTLEGTTIQTTEGKYTNYYLSNGKSGVGFYKVTNAEGQSIGANRCYLPILTDIPVNGAEGDAEVIKVSAAKQVPYYTSKNIDFTSLDAQGIKAYTATGYNYGSGVIWLTRVKKVPAQTGILVMADVAGEYSVPTTSVQSVYENMFTGSETAQTIYTTEEIDGITYINYYLSNGTSGVGFYKVTKEDGVKMGANRSYLQIPKRNNVSGVRGESIVSAFPDVILSDNDDNVIGIPVFGDDATGISSVQFQDAEQDVWYNLQGQRVEKPDKGVYIKNGKKVIVR